MIRAGVLPASGTDHEEAVLVGLAVRCRPFAIATDLATIGWSTAETIHDHGLWSSTPLDTGRWRRAGGGRRPRPWRSQLPVAGARYGEAAVLRSTRRPSSSTVSMQTAIGPSAVLRSQCRAGAPGRMVAITRRTVSSFSPTGAT